ncbi:hypothetical protein BdWA1_001335 [Babesia duncani]|uniref:RAP domain-containing protein n=1 Tax=Babesia duncani TaxID=323732 RepID=A0AAD9UQY2_9APIC|nr:hypothetical protein BdWA1_001335 [Babesia duncani]
MTLYPRISFNIIKRFQTTAAIYGNHARHDGVGLNGVLETFFKDGHLSGLIATLNHDNKELLELGFGDIQEIAKQYRKLNRQHQIPHNVNEKMSILISEYFEKYMGMGFEVHQCLEIFDTQCQTRIDKQTGLLAWNMFSIAKERCNDCNFQDWLDLVIRILKRLLNYNILYPEMLDFVSQYISKLDKNSLLDFATIAQRNGLRSKHHLDAACNACLERLDEFDFPSLVRLLHCFCYFSYEYKNLFVTVKPQIQGGIAKLSQDDILMVLNVCKTLHKDSFVDLRDGILEHLMAHYDTCTPKFLLATLSCLTRGTRTFIGGQYVIKVLDTCKDELNEISVQRLVDIMTCIDYWNIRVFLLTPILEMLSTRIKQVAYNRNLGLWSDIYNVIYSTGWVNIDFLKAASTNIIMEPQLLHRVSTHQIVKVLQTYYKLRYFHQGAYEAMLRAIDADFKSIEPRLHLITEALLAAADANMNVGTFNSKALDAISNTIISLDLGNCEDLSRVLQENNLWPRNLVTAAWSLVVFDLHKDPKFGTIIDILARDEVINEFQPFQNLVLMGLELAEACIIDNVHVDKCQHLLLNCGDLLRQHVDSKQQQEEEEGGHTDLLGHVRSDTDFEGQELETRPRPRRSDFMANQDAHFVKGRKRATRHISDILHALKRRDVLIGVAPHYNSPYIIDICFSSEDKRGIVLFSGRELLRNQDDGKWTITETGSTLLKRKILKSSGWTVSVYEK